MRPARVVTSAYVGGVGVCSGNSVGGCLGCCDLAGGVRCCDVAGSGVGGGGVETIGVGIVFAGGLPLRGGWATNTGAESSVKAALSRSTEILSSLVPTLTLKYLSCLAMTSYGPSYGVWRGDFLKSRRMKTNFAFDKFSGTFVLGRPWWLAGMGPRSPTRSRSCRRCSFTGACAESWTKSPGTVRREP